jgi:hypothetical protein
MWPPKRWEIESGHIRISSWVQGERRRRRRRSSSIVCMYLHMCQWLGLWSMWLVAVESMWLVVVEGQLLWTFSNVTGQAYFAILAKLTVELWCRGYIYWIEDKCNAEGREDQLPLSNIFFYILRTCCIFYVSRYLQCHKFKKKKKEISVDFTIALLSGLYKKMVGSFYLLQWTSVRLT